MILAEKYDLWAAVFSGVCILAFGSLQFGAWMGRGVFWIFHRRG